MNDLAFICNHAAGQAAGLANLDLTALHHFLQRNIVSARSYQKPIELIARRNGDV